MTLVFLEVNNEQRFFEFPRYGYSFKMSTIRKTIWQYLTW